MAEQLAITPDGIIKSVSAFSRAEKWWCDGEDCGGDGPNGPDLAVPHVHPMYGPARPADLLTGREVDGRA